MMRFVATFPARPARPALRPAAIQGPAGSPQGYTPALILASVFLFLTYSRLNEFYLPWLHLPLLTSLLAMMICAITGRLQRAFDSPVTKLMLVFTAWMILGLPFAVWRRATFELIVEVWSKGIMLMIVLAAVADTVKHLRVMTAAMGAAAVTIAVISQLAGVTSADGRLTVPGSTLQNPNDLAQLILISLPFWVFASLTRRTPVLKYGMLAVTLPVLIVLMQTGSRGAVLVIALLTVLFLFSLGPVRAVATLVPLGVAGLVALSFTPEATLSRIFTIFASRHEVSSQDELSAVASRESRLFLLREALRLTFDHPLLGVGAGGFMAAANDAGSARQGPTKWQETHNAYVQVSSETGIPGFLLYFGAMGLCLVQLHRIRKKARAQRQPDMAGMAQCIQFSLLAFAVSSLFSNYAYLMYFPTLAGLTVALERIARRRPAAAAPVLSPSRLAVAWRGPLRGPRQ